MFTHSCIKPTCKKQYQSEDPEPYYCEDCNKMRLAIAKEIDSKVRPSKQVKSDLQAFDEAPKVHGFLHVRL